MRYPNLLSVLVVLVVLVLCLTSAVRAGRPYQQTVTLSAKRDKLTGKPLDDGAAVDFRRGAVTTRNAKDWDLGYGGLQINREDWFGVSAAREKRNVMKDLGQLRWSDSCNVPVLEPFPELKKGENRRIAIDASADTHKAWAASTQMFAKVIAGDLYAMHVKDEYSDFYVLFRVEDHEQGDHCTISWTIADSPQ
jgi:hypothetical protein